LMTRGGPLDATNVLALEIYDFAFRRLQIGQAAAMSFLLFVIVGLFTVIQLRLGRNDWEL
jgi:multiple sugar transport system permease protein